MTPKQPTLQELFTHARTQAATMFHETGEILPMWHAIAGDGEHLIIATPFGDDDEKDDTMTALRAMFHERRVTKYVFMCEAWALKLNEPINERASRPSSRNKDGARLLLQDLPRPSEHEDRREVLRINAEDRAGNVLSGQFYILRPEHGKPTLSPFEQDDTKGIVAGRMSGLLAPSKNYN